MPNVIVVGAGNAGLCAALAAAEQGAAVTLVERAPRAERGGNSAFTAGAMRVAYDGVDDLRLLMPDLTEAELGGHRLRHVHRRCTSSTTWPGSPSPRCDPDLTETLVTRSLRHPGVDADQGRALHPDLRPPGVQGRRAVQVLGRAHRRGVGGGPGLVDALCGTAAAHRDQRPLRGPCHRADRRRRRRARRRAGRGKGRTTQDIAGGRGGAGLRRLRGQRRVAGPLPRAGLGPREGARHPLQHRRRHPDGARHRRAGRPATGPAATPSAGTATRPSSATCEVGDGFQKHSYPFGIMVNADGKRFVDEGADFRNYTYAKYGREVLQQPRPVRLAGLRRQGRAPAARRVPHPRGHQGDRRHPRGAVAQARRRRPGRRSSTPSKRFNAAVQPDVPFNPNVKDGRGTDGIDPRKSNWAQRARHAAVRGVRRSPAASPSPSAACAIDPRTREVLDGRRQRDPRPVRLRRAGRRPVLLQLPGRHRADGGRGVRPDRRRPGREQRRRARGLR